MSSTLLPIPSDSVTEECWTDTIIHVVEVLSDLGFELDLKGRRMERKGMFVFFRRDPGFSALQSCFKYAPQAGRSVGAGELLKCFHAVLRAASQARTSLLLWGKAFWD